MAHSAVAADLLEALDVKLHLTAKLTFNAVVADGIAQQLYLLFGQFADTDIRVDACRVEDFVAAWATNPVDIGEGDCDPLITRNIDTFNTSHLVSISYPSCLSVSYHRAVQLAMLNQTRNISSRGEACLAPTSNPKNKSRQGKDERFGVGDGDGVFAVRAERAIDNFHRPVVIQNFCLRISGDNHRFQGESHAGL